MKLLIDMNLSPRWTGVLADEGFDAAHGLGLGGANAPRVDPLRTRLRLLPLKRGE